MVWWQPPHLSDLWQNSPSWQLIDQTDSSSLIGNIADGGRNAGETPDESALHFIAKLGSSSRDGQLANRAADAARRACMVISQGLAAQRLTW